MIFLHAQGLLHQNNLNLPAPAPHPLDQTLLNEIYRATWDHIQLLK